MYIFESILSNEIKTAIGWTIIHSIWQISVISLLVAMASIFMRNFSSKSRYRVLSITLIIITGISIATFVSVYHDNAGDINQTGHIAIKTPDTEISVDNITKSSVTQPEKLVIIHQNKLLLKDQFTYYFNLHLPLIVSIWLLGFCIFLLRLLGGFAFTQRMKRTKIFEVPNKWQEILENLCNKMIIKKTVKLVQSGIVKVPSTIGFFKPVILFPLAMLSNLPVDQVEAIMIHELSHIRRNDYVVNLLLSILETIFFYHPALWWLSSQIKSERENCCDDSTIEIISDKLAYANALSNLYCSTNNLNIPAMTLFKKKRKLLNRIQRLFSNRQSPLPYTQGITVACVAVSLMITLFFTSGALAGDSEKSPIPEKDITSDIIASFKENISENSFTTKDKNTIAANENSITHDPAPINDNDLLVLNQKTTNGKNSKSEPEVQEKKPEPKHSDNEKRTENYDNFNNAPLLIAIKYNNENVVNTLLKEGANINIIDKNGWTPLMVAVKYSPIGMVKVILDNGADINARNNDNWTPLMIAAKYANVEIVKLLIEYGAEINVNDNELQKGVIKSFIMPVDGDVFLTPIDGHANSRSDFGIGGSGGFKVIFKDLPEKNAQYERTKIGTFNKGDIIPFYVSNTFQGADYFACSEYNDVSSNIAFADLDNSLGIGSQSIIRRISDTEYVLYIDDASSRGSADDDNDIIIKLDIEPGK